MIETRDAVVYRRILDRKALTTREVELVWRTVLLDGLPVQRTLLDAQTGVILDDVIVGQSDTPHRLDPRRLEAVVATPTRADDRVVEDGRDDRTLAR
jgi:hypothetical protein